MEYPQAASLLLENGLRFPGRSFGSPLSAAGEVVFNTAMVGYPESLTDPSYADQILVLTYPLVGNYGFPSGGFTDPFAHGWESEKIHLKGLIVSDYSEAYSHWNAQKSLGKCLEEQGVCALTGIDTRELAKVLRQEGALKGKIVIHNEDIAFEDTDSKNLIAQVSCREVIRYGEGKHRIVLVDCGTKHNILRSLLSRDTQVIRVPWDYDFTTLDYDGLFISNGPGNPDHAGCTVSHLRHALSQDRPIFGICMGNQLLAKAAGAQTYKLKYGHRSHNQPVRMHNSTRCFITSQNHGYAVDQASLPPDWEVLFENMNDHTNEGIRHKYRPFFSAQFHPEAASGPTDTDFLFDDFMHLIQQA